MTQHRAWRIYVDRSNGQGIVGLSEIQFRETSGGADWTNAGVGSVFASSFFNASFVPANAFDNTTSEWASVGAPTNNINQWIGWDLGLNPANWKDLAEIVLTARTTDPTNGPGQMIKYCRVEWTDEDPATGRWTRDWAIGPSTGWAASEARTFTRPSKTGQTRWRIFATATPQGQYMAFNEIELYNAIGGSNIATGGTAISSGDYSVNNAAAKAFDGVTAVAGTDTDTWANDGILPAWIGYQLAAADTVVQVKLWPRDDSPNHNQTPQRFSLDAGTDGVAWVVVEEWYTVPWSAGVPVTVTVPQADRITIDKIAEGVLLGGVDTRLTADKIAVEALIGGRTDMLSISKIVPELLSGALPLRITFSKLSVELLEGALPQRITFSKLAVELLVAPPLRAINGPVQII